MKALSRLSKKPPRTLFERIVLFAVIAFMLAPLANAAPITYTAFTITDGSLGSWQFHNARVYITLETDTSNAQLATIQGVRVVYVGPFPAQQLCTGPATSIGTARVTIITAEKRVRATFVPNQLIVSIDLDNGGVGFSSCGPNGFEPAYPLGISDGTIDAATDAFGAIPDTRNPSPELAGLFIDLMHDTAFSGRASVCVGFPTGGKPCSPPNPLKTNKGDLLLLQPYQKLTPNPPNPPDFGDTLSGGWFYAVVGGESVSEDDSSSPHIPLLAAADESQHERRPITYTGFVIADVQIGANLYFGAQVYLSLEADARNVMPLPNRTCPSLPRGVCGYINDGGRAKVKVISGNQTITAHFTPNQIYAFFDIAQASVGFGSHIGGQDFRAYPLTLTQHDLADGVTPCFVGNACSLTENSLIGAVADIQSTGDTANYTPETATLTVDLKSAMTLSGPASSCTSFDPTSSVCSSPTVVALQTDQGGFYLFAPYTDDDSTSGTQPFSVNWGGFWANVD